MNASIDASALEALAERLEQVPKVIKEAKRQAFQAAAPKLKGLVDAQIGGSGRVRSWQGAFVGSKGGYAAVRPKVRTSAPDHRGRPTRYAVGYVTNAVNSGHRTPRNKQGYRTSAKVIPGKQFYERAQDQAEQITQQVGEQILQTLADHLGG